MSFFAVMRFIYCVLNGKKGEEENLISDLSRCWREV
jgi:hypothetical protein